MSENVTRASTVESFVGGEYVHDKVEEKGGTEIGYVERETLDALETDVGSTEDIFDELEEIAEVFEENRDEFAETLCDETKYPISDCYDRVDSIPRYLAGVREYHEELQGQTNPDFDYNGTTEHDRKVTTISQPLGHLLMVTPRNATILAPVNLASALIGGNNVTLRPSTRTPASAAAMLRPFLERFPDRVNLVFTDPKIIYEPDILSKFDLLHYEGSSNYYQDIKSSASNVGVKSYVEGEGNGVFVVDEKPSEAADVFATALTRCNGQLCSTPSGLMVEESIADEFETELLDRLRGMTAGDPHDPETDVSEDAQPIAPDDAETFFQMDDGPVRLLEYDDEVSQTELFGPCAWYDTWSSPDEVRDLLADREHGLSISIFSQEPETYLHSLKAVSCRVCLNEDPTIISHFSPWGAMNKSGESPVNTRIQKFTQNVIVAGDQGGSAFQDDVGPSTF